MRLCDFEDKKNLDKEKVDRESRHKINKYIN